jgi:hypothetical protein
MIIKHTRKRSILHVCTMDRWSFIHDLGHTKRILILPGPVKMCSLLYLIVISLGYRLDKCFYTETRVGSMLECVHLCLRENGRCLSINIEKTKGNGGCKCQLNNSTKEHHVDKFIKDATYTYCEPIKVCIFVIYIWILILQHLTSVKCSLAIVTSYNWKLHNVSFISRLGSMVRPSPLNKSTCSEIKQKLDELKPTVVRFSMYNNKNVLYY